MHIVWYTGDGLYYLDFNPFAFTAAGWYQLTRPIVTTAEGWTHRNRITISVFITDAIFRVTHMLPPQKLFQKTLQLDLSLPTVLGCQNWRTIAADFKSECDVSSFFLPLSLLRFSFLCLFLLLIRLEARARWNHQDLKSRYIFPCYLVPQHLLALTLSGTCRF